MLTSNGLISGHDDTAISAEFFGFFQVLFIPKSQMFVNVSHRFFVRLELFHDLIVAHESPSHSLTDAQQLNSARFRITIGHVHTKVIETELEVLWIGDVLVEPMREVIKSLEQIRINFDFVIQANVWHADRLFDIFALGQLFLDIFFAYETIGINKY
jgi:hypothetical protein